MDFSFQSVWPVNSVSDSLPISLKFITLFISHLIEMSKGHLPLLINVLILLFIPACGIFIQFPKTA